MDFGSFSLALQSNGVLTRIDFDVKILLAYTPTPHAFYVRINTSVDTWDTREDSPSYHLLYISPSRLIAR